MERIWTPRPMRGTRESKSAGFTTRMSAVTASMTNSAVLPMKNRFSPERETTPIATMAQRSRLAVRGMTSFGRPSTRWQWLRFTSKPSTARARLRARGLLDLLALGADVDQRSVRHGGHHRQRREQRMQRVQLAMQRMHQLRTGAQDLPIEIGGLGVRM